MSRDAAARERDLWALSRADLALIVGGLAVMLVLALLSSTGWSAPPPDRLGLILLTWAPLLLIARWPEGALAGAVATECLYVAVVPLVAPLQFTALPIATMIAAYSLATRRPPRVSWAAGGTAAAALLVAGIIYRPADQLASAMFAVDLVIAATAVGVLIRSRQKRLNAMERRALMAEQAQLEEAQKQVATERLRIARELHDVLAHNLALVNAQAAVAEYLLQTDPVAASMALREITKHTGQALDELRATVGLLRQDDEPGPGTGTGGSPRPDELHPAPGLARLDDLVAGFVAAGTPVTAVSSGAEQKLTAHADLAAYRIVQEALTNANKHSPDAAVTVALEWSKDGLELLICNDAVVGRVPREGTVGTGHGLIGMRERALAAGGTFSSGRRPEGGFAVAATIPIKADNELGQKTTP